MVPRKDAYWTSTDWEALQAEVSPGTEDKSSVPQESAAGFPGSLPNKISMKVAVPAGDQRSQKMGARASEHAPANRPESGFEWVDELARAKRRYSAGKLFPLVPGEIHDERLYKR